MTLLYLLFSGTDPIPRLPTYLKVYLNVSHTSDINYSYLRVTITTRRLHGCGGTFFYFLIFVVNEVTTKRGSGVVHASTYVFPHLFPDDALETRRMWSRC